MKQKYDLSIKFFTETKNEEQINIAYNEIERFLTVFYNFKFYFCFDPSDLGDYENILSEEDKYNKFNLRNKLKDENFLRLVNDYKLNTSSDIFGNGNYNFELYRYALDKIMEEERKEKDEEEKRIYESQPKFSLFEKVKNSNIYYLFSFGVVLFTFIILASGYFNYFSVPRSI